MGEKKRNRAEYLCLVQKKQKNGRKIKKIEKIHRSSENKKETIYLIRPDYLGIKENDKKVIETTIKENYKKETFVTPELQKRISGYLIK